ncbi:hypothetical protein [Anaerosolibacter sp.]|uniref:hypothetical protein n=1 Tax=Anaerosolibacter sp. TaxID=1872527 RepID=UPI0039F13FEC
MKFDQIIEKGIYALEPTYMPSKGNVTKIIGADGSIYIDSRVVKTVLKSICKHYAVHIEHCREKYGKMINQRLSVPLPIHKDLLLIPVKVRKPMFANDGACGYINLHGIEVIQGKDENTVFVLKNGAEIECMHRLRTVYQHVNNARLIARQYSLFGDDQEGYDRVHEFYELYHTPATKGDIELLKKEVLELIAVLKKSLVKKGP